MRETWVQSLVKSANFLQFYYFKFVLFDETYEKNRMFSSKLLLCHAFPLYFFWSKFLSRIWDFLKNIKELFSNGLPENSSVRPELSKNSIDVWWVIWYCRKLYTLLRAGHLGLFELIRLIKDWNEYKTAQILDSADLYCRDRRVSASWCWLLGYPLTEQQRKYMLRCRRYVCAVMQQDFLVYLKYDGEDYFLS